MLIQWRYKFPIETGHYNDSDYIQRFAVSAIGYKYYGSDSVLAWSAGAIAYILFMIGTRKVFD